MKKKILIGILTFATFAVSLTGCGQSSTGNGSYAGVTSNESYLASGSKDSGYSDYYDYDYYYDVEYEVGDLGDASGSALGDASYGGSTGAGDVVVDTRKLIKTVSLDVETLEFDELLVNLENEIKAAGGYIEQSNISNGTYYDYYGNYNPSKNRTGYMTIRIPSKKLDDFMGKFDGVYNVVNKSERVSDVTLDYVDLQSYLTTLRAEEERLLELLDMAANLDEILVIERELTSVRYSIESTESQIRTYDNLVDYSTVYLNITEVTVYTPEPEPEPEVPPTAWERIRDGFTGSLKSLGKGLGEFGINLIIALPYLLFVAFIIFVNVMIIVLIVKASKKKAAKRSAERIANGYVAAPVYGDKMNPVYGEPAQNVDVEKINAGASDIDAGNAPSEETTEKAESEDANN